MRLRSLVILICSMLLLFAGSCSNGALTTATDPEPSPPGGLDALPAPGSYLPSTHIDFSRAKNASEPLVRTVFGDDNGYHTENAEVSGTDLVLNSGETELSAGIWLAYITYFEQEIPYVAPYSITVHTDGGGPFWVALGDFTSRSWTVPPVAYTGTESTVEVGLTANAADDEGVFYFAVIAYGGDSVVVESIDLSYPEIPTALNRPLDYEQFIEMRDGTELATNVFLPVRKDPGPVPQPPYPVILMRTPYDKDAVLATQIDGLPIAAYLANLNVMLVIQYFRGRLDEEPEIPGWPNSYGVPSVFRDHNGPLHYDAIDTVGWIEGRQFYNGDLGLTGPSALGVWIYQAAPSLGDRIAGIYPQAAAGDIGDWAVRRNGAYKIGNVNGWVNSHDYPPELVEELLENLLSDSFWNAVDFDQRADTARTPGFHETGWWDVDVEATIKSWSELQHNGGAGAQNNQHLVIGPWSHDTFRQNEVGEIAFPTTPEENDATNVPADWDGAQWLLSVLGRNPFFELPTDSVRYYMMGEEGATSGANNRWFTAADWPPDYTETTLYLASGETGLVESAPAEGSLSYVVGLEGIPTFGGANLPESGLNTGPYDQIFAYESGDILQFRGSALAEALPIAGPVTVQLYFELTDETAAVDTNIYVKLIDEYPTGEHMLVADSAVRLKWYLDQLPEPQDVVPGTVYPIDVEVGQRAYVFETGHKIGLDIQGSNVFRFAENAGDGSNSDQHQIDQNCVVYLGGEQASRLVLPEFDPLS